MTTEATQLMQEARDRAVWYSFWVSNRQYFCEANRLMLDGWLTENLKVLSPESLQEALDATKSQLARVSNPLPIRLQVEPVAADATPAVEIEEGPDSAIPVEITREVILKKYDKDEYRALLKRYGQTAVMARVNRRTEA